MSASPFDHPLLSHLVGDAEIAALFTPEAELKEMLAFEAALAEAEAAEGVIPQAASTAIAATLKDFKPDLAALAAGVAKDGLPVPALVKQIKARLSAGEAQHFHFGTTSQDLIDTGLALRLRAVAHVLDERLVGLIERLDGVAGQHGKRELMGRTR